MIIWTGWGVLTIFFYAIAGAIGAFVGEAIFPGDRQGMKLVLIGVLFLGASVGLWFAGRALNVTAPAGKVQSALQDRAHYYQSLAVSGQLQTAFQLPAPVTPEQGQAVIQQRLQADSLQLAKGLRNRHTLFWIPMQWWALIGAIGGLAVVIIGIAVVVLGE